MMNKEGHSVKGQDGKNYRLPDTKKENKEAEWKKEMVEAANKYKARKMKK